GFQATLCNRLSNVSRQLQVAISASEAVPGLLTEEFQSRFHNPTQYQFGIILQYQLGPILCGFANVFD
ncbi:MAG: hypothetical protein CME01_05560, partial [Geminicoccus sp.]|nr:hypothetical protein [Geminicoccus sp.]